jgi:hypothetical protein
LTSRKPPSRRRRSERGKASRPAGALGSGQPERLAFADRSAARARADNRPIQARSSAHDGAVRFITLNASQRLASVHSKGTLSFGAY